jgi:DNA helicase IV
MAIKYPPDRLSRSQLIVSNLPPDKSYVICGGPGTGKTLMALLRADQIRSTFSKEHGRKPKLLFLVFNRPLQNYLKPNVSKAGLTEKQAMTWHSWMWHHACPEYLGTDNPNDLQIAPYKYDWDKVMRRLREHNNGKATRIEHVILDEAQDMPEGLVTFLNEISNNITVFMDDHQMIDEQDNDRDVKEIKLTRNRALQIVADGDPYRLQFLLENHRNSQAIVDLANLFMRDGGIAPDALNKGGRKPEVLVYGDLDEFAQEVASYAEDNPDQNISVFLPTNEEKSSFVDVLRVHRTVKNGVREYKDGYQTPNFDPEEKQSVKVFSYRTFKGLEFAAVFMPEIDGSYFDRETEVRLNQAMVGITRAEERIFIGCKNIHDTNSFFLRRLRADQTVFETRVLSDQDVIDDDDIPF